MVFFGLSVLFLETRVKLVRRSRFEAQSLGRVLSVVLVVLVRLLFVVKSVQRPLAWPEPVFVKVAIVVTFALVKVHSKGVFQAS